MQFQKENPNFPQIPAESRDFSRISVSFARDEDQKPSNIVAASARRMRKPARNFPGEFSLYRAF